MSIEQTHYYTLVDLLSSRCFVRTHPPLYSLSNSPTYKEFSKDWKSTDWKGRKLRAIPLAAKNGFLFITLLAKAIITAVKMRSIRSYTTKVQAFTAFRQSREALGHLVTLFNDCYGQYLVQESRYYKEQYKSAPLSIETLKKHKKTYQNLKRPTESALHEAKKITKVETKEKRLFEIATEALKTGKTEFSEQVVTKVKKDHKKANEFKKKVADQYYTNGKYIQAFEIAKNTVFADKELFYMNLIQKLHEKKNTKDLKVVLCELLEDLIAINMFFELETYEDIIINHSDASDKFFKKNTDILYQEIKPDLDKKDTLAAQKNLELTVKDVTCLKFKLLTLL